MDSADAAPRRGIYADIVYLCLEAAFARHNLRIQIRSAFVQDKNGQNIEGGAELLVEAFECTLDALFEQTGGGRWRWDFRCQTFL